MSQAPDLRIGMLSMNLRFPKGRLRSVAASSSLLACSALVLAGCSGADLFAGNEFFSESSMGVKASPRVTTSRKVPKGGGRYQVGNAYTVAGQTFTPREQPDLDQTGRASWYGPAFHGRLTANGEVFDQYHLSGAHPTLPLPSYVRVTNVDNGASAIVRINDRGPFSRSRVIDLSRRTAEVLGYQQQGIANVRVQYVGPAPLNGDDTRFLVSSINNITPYETQTRMAYQQTQVAQAAPAPSTALDAVSTAAPAPAVPADIPFQILSYASGADAAVEPFGRSVSISLGSFEDSERAQEIARAFAMLGAVDSVTAGQGDYAVTQLSISHLRDGVSEADVQQFATGLGLSPAISY
jgi:rare lipoprotein A